MSLRFNLKKGFDINLEGASSNKVGNNYSVNSYAVKPTDFIGITRPKLLVEVGDEVKAGSPILFDKLSEKIMYCSPVSGEISDLIRGDKRRLEEIRILPDKDNIYRKFKKFSVGDVESLDREKIIDHLCDSGVWPNIIQRPFGHVADTNVSPKAIHISFFDTSPLSPRLLKFVSRSNKIH